LQLGNPNNAKIVSTAAFGGRAICLRDIQFAIEFSNQRANDRRVIRPGSATGGGKNGDSRKATLSSRNIDRQPRWQQASLRLTQYAVSKFYDWKNSSVDCGRVSAVLK